MCVTAAHECQDVLLDLVCYEMRRGNLSSEMELFLSEHLDSCPGCRQRMRNFFRLLAETEEIRNFG